MSNARRFALPLWLGVVAALGVVRFAMRPQADLVAWLWLAGGVAVGVAAVVAWVQVRKARPER